MVVVEEIETGENLPGNSVFLNPSLNHDLSNAPWNNEPSNAALKIDEVNFLAKLPKAIARLFFSTFLEPLKGFPDILALFIKLIVGIFFMLILPIVLLAVALFLLPLTLLGLVGSVVLFPLTILSLGLFALAVIGSILMRNPAPAILGFLGAFGPLLGVGIIGACLALAAVSFLAGLVITALSLIILPIQLITRSIATIVAKCCSDTDSEENENLHHFSMFSKNASKSGKENQNQNEEEDQHEESRYDLTG